MPSPSSAIASTTTSPRRASETSTRWPPCSSAFCSSSANTSASAVARAPGQRHRLERRDDILAAADALHEHRAQPADQIREIDVLLALLGEQLVHRRDGEDAVDGVLERLARIDRVRRARLQPQQRRDRLQVVLDPVVDLLSQHAAQHRTAVLERHRRVRRDRGEHLAVDLA